jgi:hypothetical protein
MDNETGLLPFIHYPLLRRLRQGHLEPGSHLLLCDHPLHWRLMIVYRRQVQCLLFRHLRLSPKVLRPGLALAVLVS